MTNTGEGSRYRAADLVDFARALFAAAGCDGGKASATIAEHLVEADLMGHTTHGLARPAPISTRLGIGCHGEDRRAARSSPIGRRR